MGQLRVSQVQGTAASNFTVTVPEGSTLQLKDSLRVVSQSYHQLPRAQTPNYFATKFNPIDLHRGSFDEDGNRVQEVFGTTATRATMSRDDTVTDSPAGGVPLRMVTTATNDPYTNTYNSATWNFADGLVASGQTWTFSVYVKADRSTQAQIFLFEANSAGSYSALTQQVFNVSTSWQRISITRTLSNTSSVALQVRLDGADSGTTGTVYWWDGVQVERGNTATEFTPSADPILENPYSQKEGSIRWADKDKRLQVFKEELNWVDTAGDSNTFNTQPVGTFGLGGGFSIAEGADATEHNNYTSRTNYILHEGLRYNDGTTGDETLSATGNLRGFLDYVSSTSGSDFAFHTGHTNPGNVSWPQYLAIKVTNYKYGKVLNRIRWYRHQNMVGNVNIWGSNQSLDRTNFTDTAGLWTFISRLHFGGAGGAASTEGQQVARTFDNQYGYRWYMIEMVDINSTALSYPQVGTTGGWAAYGVTFDLT